MFEEKTVSPKKRIVKLLSGQPANGAEMESFDNLKWFLKNLTDGALSAFLQFTTGSDIIIPCDSLEVTFVNVDGILLRGLLLTHVSRVWNYHQHTNHSMNCLKSSVVY